MIEKYGVDVSHWNNPDFKRLKDEFGIDFAILKLGTFGSNMFFPDVSFNNFANQCEKHKIPYGAYVYLNKSMLDNAIDPTHACMQSLRALWGRKLDYPLYLDVEENNIKTSIAGRTMQILQILKFWEDFGFYAGIYASEKSGFRNILELSKSTQHYTFWVANWTEKPKIPCGMWQCVNGKDSNIMGLDYNVCYVDFPAAVKREGLNGYWK